MSDSPESVVRNFLAAWAHPNLDELVSFFSDDAVFIDGPRGVHHGVDAIRSELDEEIAMGFGGAKIDINSLVAQGGTVMLEGVENYRIGGQPFTLEVMGSVRRQRRRANQTVALLLRPQVDHRPTRNRRAQSPGRGLIAIRYR